MNKYAPLLPAVLIALFLAAPPALSAFSALDGWAPESEPRIYGPENLWDEINGGAEVFVSYGFRELEIREITADSITVSVGIYDMGSRLNAYGMFRTETPEDAEFGPIGVRSYIVAPYLGLLLKDRFYVKASAYTGKMGEAEYAALLASLAAALPGGDDLPDELALLPAEGKIAGSDRFTRESFLGLKELRHCVHARYGDGTDREWKIFRIVPVGNENAEKTWAKLAKKWSNPGVRGASLLTREVPYQGTIGVVRSGDGIIGVAGLEGKELTDRLLQLAASSPPGGTGGESD